MPTVFSMALRLSEPGDPVSLFTTGDASTDTFPSRSVRPRNWSVSFSFTGVPARWRCACTRIMRRGKSSSHSWGGT